MKREKLIGLQILRGVAAWLVVMRHVNQEYFDYNPPIKFLSIFNYGSFGVDIFFVLSGFIMYYSVKHNKKGGVSFFLDRFFRIFPVYWFMTVLLIISSLILPNSSYGTSFTYESLLKSFFLIPHENPSGFGNFPFLSVGWTLIYEMFFYVILSISLIIYKKRALIITVTLLTILPILLGNHNLLGSSNFLLIEFVTGVIIAYIYSLISTKKYYKKIQKPQVAILLLITTIIFCSIAIYKAGFLATRIVCANLLVFNFLIVEHLVRQVKRFKTIVFLGDISYSTYLIHYIILGWFYVPFSFTDNLLIKFLIILIFFYSVYVLSKLSYKYIEINKWLLGIKDRLKNHYLVSPKNITQHNNGYKT